MGDPEVTAEDLARVHAQAMDSGPAWSAADFAGLLAAPGVFALGDDRGVALGRVAADEAELLTIAVLPGHRGAGVGRSLLAAFETEAARAGARVAFLEVAADNHAARALYTRGGYVETGRRKGYYRLPEGGRTDALTMTRALHP
ncbi:GNAT family N-acetyltransferase [Palleronia sp. KMU-117]|uniref:GNAT family N-acetyltransferase n=1 Tax=Palleronia sp. KMU-117 TaxID=3434108 RepID=UPI003D73D99D